MDIPLLDRAVPNVLIPIETAKILHIGRNIMYHLAEEND